MPTAMERLTWGFGDGSTLPVIDTDFGKTIRDLLGELYAGVADGDVSQRHPYLLRADRRRPWDMARLQLPRRRAGLGVHSRRKRHRESDGQADGGGYYEGDCILRAESDPDEITEGKFVLDVVGQYARPDALRIEVN
jgi:nitrilase